MRNDKTKVSKVWMPRTKNYTIDKDILTGDFQTSNEETESIKGRFRERLRVERWGHGKN